MKKRKRNKIASAADTEQTKKEEQNDVDKHKELQKWSVIKISKEDNPTGVLEESSFAILFPKYREKYLQEVWPAITDALAAHGIKAELNLVEGVMTVKTTRKMFDPYMIIKAKDLLKLISRSVPAPQALKVLHDNCFSDIIEINGFTKNKEIFKKRRQRLLGQDGSTLKALELLTGCYIMVQGNTVSAIGPFKMLKIVRRVAEECMQNIHPIYHIKTLMVKRELEKDPALANQNWDRFLPNFKKKNVKRHKPKVVNKKKPYTPFPPPQPPSKKDLLLESGEYFVSENKRKLARKNEILVKQEKNKVEKKSKKMQEFIPPKEEPVVDFETEKIVIPKIEDTVASLKKKNKEKRHKRKVESKRDVADFIESSREPKIKRSKIKSVD